MHALIQSLRRIPYWAYLLVLLVILVNTVYFINRYKASTASLGFIFENSRCLITSIKPGGPADKAGLLERDIILLIDTVPIHNGDKMLYCYDHSNAGDILIYTIQRKKDQLKIPVVLGSIVKEVPGFYQVLFIIFLLFSVASLFILYKKQNDLSAKIFFIYFQIFLMMTNGRQMFYQDPVVNFANIVFLFSGPICGAVLIHFHLLFPMDLPVYKRFKRLPLIFYGIAILFSIVYSVYYFLGIYHSSREYDSVFGILDQVCVSLTTLFFLVALTIAIHQFLSIKNTLARNQLRIVIFGSAIVLITPLTFAFAYDFVTYLQALYPFIVDLSLGIGGFIMIFCILIAIFRYRIWDIEVFIRRALLYLGATLVIIFTYLFLIWIVNRLVIHESNFIRFLILGVSVIIFLVLRDRMQRMIDRLFHRETYDSATVVSDFEAKLAGIYRFDELKQKIVQSLDEIFHFKSFIFNLKKEDLIYEPAYVHGIDNPKIPAEFEITAEFENKIRKSKVFSPNELTKKLQLFEMIKGDLIVPMLSEEQPAGFFICGQKKSERIYSLQDINVLALLARRVIALLHTASLYQKDLDRQLMLERERARISQDMHDDVGASLTRISMMSDLVKNRSDVGTGASQWLLKISDTSRGLMEEMNQIIWALNPKNDNLEGLVAYIRRFAFEYLEPTPASCIFDLPEKMSDLALSVEVRRNVYLVAREAIHNVVKHAGATKIWINLEMNEHGFRIKIKDDGKGFEPVNLEFAGNGLINMKKRMDDICGEFMICSKPGEGTEIDLIVPVR